MAPPMQQSGPVARPHFFLKRKWMPLFFPKPFKYLIFCRLFQGFSLLIACFYDHSKKSRLLVGFRLQKFWPILPGCIDSFGNWIKKNVGLNIAYKITQLSGGRLFTHPHCVMFIRKNNRHAVVDVQAAGLGTTGQNSKAQTLGSFSPKTGKGKCRSIR